ncbi:hypothetical protein FOMPIDRAFT_1055275 [Fomitopsis schrenkii]|uniref:DUF6533 domain-containing protein n=1 Tax=Fomitopsis schrenkii TaxID=2126942 RepID=S8EXH9_FOMSC|nr:hypothetical protein FOMPIDRAFT_1055275 [Fomitopsis schrenkii]
MSGSSIPTFAALLRSATIDNYWLVAAFVAYLYDRCLTVGQEIEHIWRRRLSAASGLYVALQLSTISMFSLELVQQLVMLDCNVYSFPESLSTIAITTVYQVMIAVISSLRVYALNPPDRVTPFIVLVLSLGPAVYEITVTIAVADVIVVLVTWRKTYHMVRLSREAGAPAPLLALLLRDDSEPGTVYFGLITVLNVPALVFFFTGAFDGFGYFSVSFTSIILSRFLLNIREAGDSPMPSVRSSSGPFSSLAFAEYESEKGGGLDSAPGEDGVSELTQAYGLSREHVSVADETGCDLEIAYVPC